MSEILGKGFEWTAVLRMKKSSLDTAIFVNKCKYLIWDESMVEYEWSFCKTGKLYRLCLPISVGSSNLTAIRNGRQVMRVTA